MLNLVIFESIGRNKKSWEVKTKAPNEKFFYQEIKKNNALYSSDIEFELLLEQDKVHTFRAWVGGIRPVGLIKVVYNGGRNG